MAELSRRYNILKPRSMIRVSCASFADIRIGDNRVLTINKNRAKRGQRVLTPVGGAIELTLAGQQNLMSLLGLRLSDFEKGLDMRFNMSEDFMDLLRLWFLSRIGRELTPQRETFEELTVETTILRPDNLHGVRFSKLGYQGELGITTRIGQEGQRTLRLVEIAATELPFTAKNLIELEANRLTSDVRLVSDDEIIRGISHQDIPIGSVAKLLLNPQPTIPTFYR